MKNTMLTVVALLGLAACDPHDGNDPNRGGGGDRSEHQSIDASFVGVWGVDAQQCAALQEVEAAPMIITENGYDQYETHCSFDSIDERGAGAWTVAGECSVQGDQQALAMHMSVANDTLTLSENGQPFAELQRCS